MTVGFIVQYSWLLQKQVDIYVIYIILNQLDPTFIYNSPLINRNEFF